VASPRRVSGPGLVASILSTRWVVFIGAADRGPGVRAGGGTPDERRAGRRAPDRRAGAPGLPRV